MTNIKQVAGIWLPATEEHLLPFLLSSSRQNQSGMGSYQLHTLAAFVDHVPLDRRRLVLDVGGNVGLWSMHFSRVFDRVVAYEPIPVNQDCFMRNTIEHPTRPTPNVELRRVALGAEVGEVTLECEPHVTSGTHVAPQDASKMKEGAMMFTSPLTTIDAERYDFVDAIKIDVEGFEYPVIKGAEETIRRCKPIICIEQKPWSIFEWGQYDAVKLLTEWGAKPLQRVVDDFIMGWE